MDTERTDHWGWRCLAWWRYLRAYAACATADSNNQETEPLLEPDEVAEEAAWAEARREASRRRAARLAQMRASGAALCDQELPPARRRPLPPGELQALQERWRRAVEAAESRHKKFLLNYGDGELYTS